MAVVIQSGTLTAGEVTTVTFTTYYPHVEVLNRGNDDIWVRLDGTTPTVLGDDTYVIPSLSWKDDLINSGTSGETIVELISNSSVAFTVEGIDF